MSNRCTGAFRKNREKLYKNNIEKYGSITCEYCGMSNLKRKVQDTGGATVDHVNPVSNGGSVGSLSNMVVACHDCNNIKADMSYEDFIKKADSNNVNGINNNLYVRYA